MSEGEYVDIGLVSGFEWHKGDPMTDELEGGRLIFCTTCSKRIEVINE